MQITIHRQNYYWFHHHHRTAFVNIRNTRSTVNPLIRITEKKNEQFTLSISR